LDVGVCCVFLRFEQIRELAASLKSHTFQADELVVREGEPGGVMYFVDSGELEVIRSSAELGGAASVYSGAKSKNRIGMLGTGDFFGEGSLFDANERSASVRTLTTVRLFELKGTKLLSVLSKFPTCLDSIYQVAYQRVGLDHLRVLFQGFEEALIPHLRLVRFGLGDVLLPNKICFAVSGTFDVADERRETVCVVKGSGFFGSVDDECNYSVIVSSSDAFCFVLDKTKMEANDLALLAPHLRNIDFFIDRGERSRQKIDVQLSELMGREVSAREIAILRKHEFGSRLVDLLNVSGSISSMGREELATCIQLLGHAHRKLVERVLK
jgi:CRP-like cAMP-binding protein